MKNLLLSLMLLMSTGVYSQESDTSSVTTEELQLRLDELESVVEKLSSDETLKSHGEDITQMKFTLKRTNGSKGFKRTKFGSILNLIGAASLTTGFILTHTTTETNPDLLKGLFIGGGVSITIGSIFQISGSHYNKRKGYSRPHSCSGIDNTKAST